VLPVHQEAIRDHLESKPAAEQHGSGAGGESNSRSALYTCLAHGVLARHLVFASAGKAPAGEGSNQLQLPLWHCMIQFEALRSM
jgi:hypothetical protein